MTNWTISRVNLVLDICWGFVFVYVVMVLGVATITACAKIPHDFGMYNDLKTICHVWKGRDGFRRQVTQHINSSENIHGSHVWDYDGECNE